MYQNFKTSILMGSSTNPEALNIEELIDCVHIGKTLTSNIYRRHQETRSLQCNSKKQGDFDPLTLLSTARAVIEMEPEVTVEHKRVKLLTELPSSEPLCEKTSKSNIEFCVPSGSHLLPPTYITDSCNETKLKKARRKRVLVDEDLSVLRTPDNSKPPSSKRPFLQTENEPITTIKICNVKDKAETSDDNASKSWLPPSPDSLSEDEKDSTLKDILPRSDECGNNGQQKTEDMCHSLKVTLHNMVIADSGCVEESLCTVDNSPTHKHILPNDDSISNANSQHECEKQINAPQLSVTGEATREPTNNTCHSPPTKRSLRSSQKHIRKTLPPVQVRQTPMGLPKPLRIKKEKFSVEEIYTNKNYSTPIPKALETIFEYPKLEKDGTTKFLEKRRRARTIYFNTNPAERPTKKRKLKQGNRVSTRRHKVNKDLQESNLKLNNILAELDEQLQLHNLSP